MEEKSPRKNVTKQRLLRCADWIQKQKPEDYKDLKNFNVQFVLGNEPVDSNQSVADEDAMTVPNGVDEIAVKPTKVPLHRLRLDQLHIPCEWQQCQWFTENYETFQKHVAGHIPEVHAAEVDGVVQYTCLWDICDFKTSNFDQMKRHINYHAYHAKLMAVGYNGRATLKLMRCKKDSCKRNVLPELLSEHQCMWTGCEEKFNSIQVFFTHVRQHVNYAESPLCSWAGCGATFLRKMTLATHVRSHCGERLIACAHCGSHFANNRKLADHLRRQNADPSLGLTCAMCGLAFASPYLLREHARRHVSVYACALCDMSAPSLASLATHVAYRHMDNRQENRMHQCPHCSHRSITKWDLRRHITTHNKKSIKKKKSTKEEDNEDSSDSEDSGGTAAVDLTDEKKTKEKRKYICHMCPEAKNKVFTRGGKLTTHLVKIHGVQWPCGHSRFRYQISKDGMYRLTTTRYESLEVSKKIVEGNGSREQITSSFDFEIEETSEATEKTPKHFVVKIKDESLEDKKAVEITMCDVDEEGNIICSEVISDVVYS